MCLRLLLQSKHNGIPGFLNDPFSYYFLDEAFDKQYKTDQQFESLFTVFAASQSLLHVWDC